MAERPLRVLVVDDSEDTTMSSSMLLEREGFEVFAANSGQGALKLAELENPDVILLDLAMPHMDGYECARRLRKLSKKIRPVLIAVTGLAPDEHLRRSLSSGFDFLLAKPVEPNKLLAVLEVVQKMRTGLQE